MATPFMMRDKEIAALQAAQARARQKVIPLKIIKQGIADPQLTELSLERAEELKLKEKIQRPPAEQVLLPFGFRVALSYEQQPDRLCLHMSMSAPDPGRTPAPAAVEMVLRELGVDGFSLTSTPPKLGPILSMWMEEFGPGHHAVNVLIAEEAWQ